ncbi:MAG TPA: SEL1-like repeat protein [Beijerinckiaceae bacterium]|jgi:TPR repeat protein
MNRLQLLGLAFLAATAATLPAAQAREASEFDPAAARAVAAAVENDPLLAGMLRQCPADLFRREARRGSARERLSDGSCDARLGQCLKACVAGDGNACLNLARSFEEHEEAAPPRIRETLFAAACAAGEGAGCTNRAAGMRNGGYDDDPFRDAPEAEKESCQFRSFAIACRLGDAWGCAMLGQAYKNGEGTPRSVAKARGAYRKSCALSPDFEACTFAKSDLEELRVSRR